MNMLKKLLSSIMAVSMLLSAAPLGEFAGVELPDFSGIKASAAEEETPTSGTCGENLTWSFDEETGTLTISGDGEMEDYYYSDWGSEIRWDAPWSSHRLSIKKLVIENGVTYIGDDAFAGCKNLAEFSLPDSVVSIGSGALSGCSALTTIIIPDTVKEIGSGEIGDQSTLEYLRIPMTEDCKNHFTYDKKSASEITITAKEIICEWSGDTQKTVLNIGSGVTMEQLLCVYDALGYVKKINLIEENENFTLLDGVLYDKNIETLIIYPAASDKKIYVMPDTVKTVYEDYFFSNISCFGALNLEELTLGASFFVEIIPSIVEEAKDSVKYIIDVDEATHSSEKDIKIAELSVLASSISMSLSDYVYIDSFYNRTLKNFHISEDHPYLKAENGFLCYKADGYDLYITQITAKTDKVEFMGNDLFWATFPYYQIEIDEVVLTDEFIKNKISFSNVMFDYQYGTASKEEQEMTDEEKAAIENLLELYKAETISNALMGIKTKKFTVSDMNKYLSVNDGVLFNKDKTILLNYPMASERKFYKIPEVKYISFYAFSSAYEGGFLKNFDLTLHLPQGITEGTIKLFLDGDYSSNYNKTWLEFVSYSVGGLCFDSNESFTNFSEKDINEYTTETGEYNKMVDEHLTELEENLKDGQISEIFYQRELAYLGLFNSHRADVSICENKHNHINNFTIDEVENTEVKFGETLTLTANLGEAGLPEGFRVEWTIEGTGAEIIINEDSLSCTVKCVDSGEITVTAKVVDAEGNTVTDEYGKDTVASQVLTMLGYVPYATIAIDAPESSEVKFGESITLTATLGEAGLPEGCRVEWTVDGTGAEITVSEDSLSCTVKCVDSGEITVTAKVVDAEGNTVTDESVNDAVASQALTMNANFFVRVVAFFKYLWNLIVSLFK